jgi:hypothetical protein
LGQKTPQRPLGRLSAALGDQPPVSSINQRLRPLVLRLAEPARGRVAGAKIHERVAARVASTYATLAPAPEQTPEYDGLGLPAGEIEAACALYGIDGLVERMPSRADTAADLHHIAWHGSALADIGCPADHPLREGLLLDGALFNLAVALTDSLVDEDPRAGMRAARVLSPQALERRLRAPGDPRVAIAGEEPDLEPLYGLWDALLARVGERFAGDPRALTELADMLRRMHRGEFDEGADRLPAKVLPVEFIGVLLREGESPAALRELYGELGRLLALSDDWNDLAEDMRRMRANQLVLMRDYTRADRLRYVARCLQRVVFSRALAEEVADRLCAGVARVLASAGEISPDTHARTASYLKGVLEC